MSNSDTQCLYCGVFLHGNNEHICQSTQRHIPMIDHQLDYAEKIIQGMKLPTDAINTLREQLGLSTKVETPSREELLEKKIKELEAVLQAIYNWIPGQPEYPCPLCTYYKLDKCRCKPQQYIKEKQ